MKEYLRPEFEEVKYDVEDCLATSGGESVGENASNWTDNDDIF